MKTKMMTMVKEVTVAILAAVTVMTAAMPAMVHAEDFNGIKLEELPTHPTSGMDINIIKNAYKVGGNLGTNIESGTVAYIDSQAIVALDGGTPCGTDIVVIYRTYQETNMFGNTSSKVCCKSLINGETFNLIIDKRAAQLYEIKKAQSLNDAGINTDSNGLQPNSKLLYKAFGWFKSIKELF